LSRLKAIRLPSGPLSSHLNQIHTLEDWCRLAAGAPTSAEEKQLREECERLEYRRHQEQEEVLRLHRQKLSQFEEELTRILKRAVGEGFYRFHRQSAQVSLREDETLHWESPATKLKQRSLRGDTYWAMDQQGTLLVTSERILLDSPPHRLWQKPLSELLRVDRQHIPQGPIIVLWLDGLQKPVGLGVTGPELSVQSVVTEGGAAVEEKTRTIKLDSSDLAQLLETLVGKRK
jgi:hypothetical protein